MHCLAEIDVGWLDDPGAAPARLAQALLSLLDREPGRALYAAAARSPAGPCGLTLDLGAGRLSWSDGDGSERWWQGATLARLERAARGAGFGP